MGSLFILTDKAGENRGHLAQYKTIWEEMTTELKDFIYFKAKLLSLRNLDASFTKT